MSWREQLRRVVGQHRERERPRRPDRADVRRFIGDVVAPALRSVAEELPGHGREAHVDAGGDEVSITVYDGEDEEFYYAVKARAFRKPSFAFPELTFSDEEEDVVHRAMVYTREGPLNYGIMGHEPEQVIANFMHEYDKQLRWQKPTKGRSGEG